MRKLITGMKISSTARWRDRKAWPIGSQAWSEDYGLMPQIDACLLGRRHVSGLRALLDGNPE